MHRPPPLRATRFRLPRGWNTNRAGSSPEPPRQSDDEIAPLGASRTRP
jgi:hypothetical protein